MNEKVVWARGIARDYVCALCGADLRVAKGLVRRAHTPEMVTADLACSDPSCSNAHPGMGWDTWTKPRGVERP